MPSFRQISAHFPALAIDAASSAIQVGVFRPDGTQAWKTSSDEAGVAVFQGVHALGVDLQDIAAFVYCDGPGSVLGIRTVAMALRTWRVLRPRPIFAYCSLAVVAHALGREDVSVIVDARRDTWHCFRLGAGLRRVPVTALGGELVMPQNFRHWSTLPPNVETVTYSLAELLPKVWEADLLQETDAPDAFLHEEPNYVTWTPQIHRAADSRS
jgi:tRNA threonylcarbamoyladenosine biosynthesis protein TsaB